MRTSFVATFVALILSWTAIPVELSAQPGPYDNAPSVEPPYYRVRYEASLEHGKLAYPVTYTVWIPPSSETLRGVIVHQHGCGVGSCKSGQTGAFDLHWQALAQKHNCALMAPSYEQPDGADCQLWCDPRNGSDVAFQQSLIDLGEQCRRAELARVPWALWGHSGGGHWAGGMLLLHPERVAAVWLRSGVPLFERIEGRAIKPHVLPDAALTVPVMCNLGTKEGVSVTDGRFAGVWPMNEAFFQKMRNRGALIGVAIDPLTAHECGNQRYLAMPWFDACLTRRLTATSGESLRPMRMNEARLAPLHAGLPIADKCVPADEFAEELSKSIWLPNRIVAMAWSQYVMDTAVADPTPPPAPTNVRLSGNTLTWDAEADLESGVSHFVIEKDGDKIATVPEQPMNRFGRPVFQGLQYSDTPTAPLVQMRFAIPTSNSAQLSQFRVRTVNTVGLISE